MVDTDQNISRFHRQSWYAANSTPGAYASLRSPPRQTLSVHLWRDQAMICPCLFCSPKMATTGYSMEGGLEIGQRHRHIAVRVSKALMVHWKSEPRTNDGMLARCPGVTARAGQALWISQAHPLKQSRGSSPWVLLALAIPGNDPDKCLPVLLQNARIGWG